MRMTAMDINNKEFKKVIRGYSPEEVNEFLDKIAEDYEVLYKENSTLKEKITNIDEKLTHYNKMESTIHNTMLLAQNASEQAKTLAQREADLIIGNANDSAKRLLDKANNDVLQINDEFERTKQEFLRFRNKYRSFMDSQLQMFDEMEKDFIKNYNLGQNYGNAVKSLNSISEKDVEFVPSIETQIENIKLPKTDEECLIKEEDLSEIKNFFVGQ